MSDVKFCFSCGASLSLNDLFCYKCGQKQVVTDESESSAPNGNINREPINDSTSDSSMNSIKPETEKTETAGEKDSSGIVPQPEVNEEKNVINTEKPEAESKDNIIETKVNEPVNTYANNLEQQQKFESPKQPVTYQDSIAQQVPSAQQSAPVPVPKKKKFPWFFTVLWLILLGAVGIWGYFLLIDPNYNYPVLTPEAQRYIIFTVAVAVLIYTLSLKLAMKKLRAIPTVLLVLFGIIIFVLFCMIELQEGNFLHDTVSEIFENVIPTFGE
ncbi:MAG: hypothetical protein GX022_06730 [Clostridiaceae bacterium]|nr:hypothetical protein [Clostridiaceae bacterium]